MKPLLRLSLFAAALLALMVCWPSSRQTGVLAASLPTVTLDAQNSAPRQVEDSTQKAVTRDYATAWQALAEALRQNREDLLAANFVGTADEKLSATIAEQRKAGLHQRIVDNGHHVDAIFYSPEGSAMELHDVAHLQLQLLDGDKVVHGEETTIHYVVLLTAAENSWKVRVLEAVPSF